MDELCILGINKDYIPPSPSFSIDSFNFTLEVNNNISSLTKISCCANGFIDDTFKFLNGTYAAIHLNIELRVDYMCINSSMNFHKFSLDKIIYINLGSNLNTRIFNIDSEILDLNILNISDNILSTYVILNTCVYN